MAKEQNSNFEAQLFKAADKLRKNIDAAEYKNVALGLIFLKYISESFQELYDKLAKDEFSDPEDRDEYKAENIFFVPEQARWKNLQAKAKLPTIGQELDDAMEAIEKENPELRNVLPKVFGKPNLDKTSLGSLIDLISNTELKATSENSKDLFGRVYEYFLGEFANAEGKKWGQFYTPKSIVKLMVEMIEPYKWRVYDPACGSGGMFVMSEKFVQEHQGNIKDITIYGQESNQTTWKLSKMNLAIRNINSQFVAWNTEWSFLKDAHPDLKADYILANPPFNQSDWGQEILQDDARRKYGIPPAGNANFAWMQHMLYHLAPHGVMATVLANWSLSSDTLSEGEIRKNLIKSNLVDCIIGLPEKLFYNTGISATIWILKKEKKNNKILFIDASKMGFMKDNIHRDLSNEEILQIVKTYKSWKNNSEYSDIKGFCKSVNMSDIEKRDFVLTPSRFVGIDQSNNIEIPFKESMKRINEQINSNHKLEIELNEKISTNLNQILPIYNWDNLSFSSNSILEKIIENIFIEWFINFNFPGNSGELYESELGSIPKDWKIGKLENIVDFIIDNRGKTPPVVEKITQDSIPLIEVNAIVGKNRTININECKKYVDLETYNNWFRKGHPEKGDVLISTVGSIWQIAQVFDEKISIAQNIIALRYKGFGNYLYELLKIKQKEILSINISSVQPSIKVPHLLSIDIIIPPTDLLKMFENIINPLTTKIAYNNSQEYLLKQLFL